MQRRTALKNIGLSFGALTLTPTVASLLQSCQTTEAGWTPNLLSQENADVMAKIIDVMLPTTANVPGASDLNLIQFHLLKKLKNHTILRQIVLCF